MNGLAPDRPASVAVAGPVGPALADPERAEAEARAALERDPHEARAWFALGVALHAQQRVGDALRAFHAALEHDPRHVQGHSACAVLLGALGRIDDALGHIRSARALAPADPLLAVNEAILREREGSPQEAFEAYADALAIDASFAPALMNLAPLLATLGRLEEARAAALRFADLYPGVADAHFNLAEVEALRHHFDAALAACDRCLAVDPGHARAHVDRGLALAMLQRFEEAAQALRAAERHDPAIWASLSAGAREFAPAGEDQVLESEPRMPEPRAVFLVQALKRLERCDWTGYDALMDTIADLVHGRDGAGIIEPALLFNCWALPVGEAIHRHVAPRAARELEARVPPRIWSRGVTRRERIRIGYLSPDFREHAAGYTLRPIVRLHDHARFEIRAYSLTPDDGGDVRREIREHVAAFVDLHEHDDAEAAWRIFRDDCDLLIDFAGYTRHARPGILAQRPASVQAHYHGFMASMGADFIDYHVTSLGASPLAEAETWSEARVFLPHTHFVYDPETEISSAPLTRAELGLPQTGVVLCCFNQSFKIDPETFDAWIRIARAVPDAVLWILAPDAGVGRRLRGEARARGLDPDRLILAPNVPHHPLHLARVARADLYLDAFWFNGHTSALDALWAGVPAITRAGSTPYGRMAASLLAALGMDELVTRTTDDFVELGVRLAADPAARSAVRARLAHNRPIEPLFDTARRVRALEAGYLEMVRRHRDGEAPGDVLIDAITLAPRAAG